MASNVIKLDGTSVEVDDPETILREAAEAELREVIVIGLDDQDRLYFETSIPTEGREFLLMELARHHLLERYKV